MEEIAPWQIWLAAIVTLGIYSYLISDNKLYRLLLNVMIGLGVGYNFIIMWKQVLQPLWWEPMTRGFAAVFNGFAPGSAGALWVLVGLLGTLWYFQFSRKYLWLSRIVIGMTLGAGAGVVFKQQLLMNMPQIADSFRPLIARADGTPLVGGSDRPPVAVDVPEQHHLRGHHRVCDGVLLLLLRAQVGARASHGKAWSLAVDGQFRRVLRQHCDDPYGGVPGTVAVSAAGLAAHRVAIIGTCLRTRNAS
jgi:hypothetical protein